ADFAFARRTARPSRERRNVRPRRRDSSGTRRSRSHSRERGATRSALGPLSRDENQIGSPIRPRSLDDWPERRSSPRSLGMARDRKHFREGEEGRGDRVPKVLEHWSPSIFFALFAFLLTGAGV